MLSHQSSVRVALCVLTTLVLVGAPRPVHGQPVVPAGFEDTLVAAVPSPTALAATPDGRLLIASQFGQIYLYLNGALAGAPALDFGTDVCTYRERGLLGLAVDPAFTSNQFIYVAYTFNKFGDCNAERFDAEGPMTPVGRVSRFQLSGNTIDRANERILIDNIPSPIGVHNLDDIEFGKDGYLYATVGDGGCDYAFDSGCFDGNNAAIDMHALVGKVLRVTRDGEIPPDNPFTGPGTVRCNVNGGAAPGSVCQEIFASGLRNPWRLAFDPNAAGTRFFINDVGQDTWEEINEGIRGADYGWNAREGFCARGSMTDCAPAPPPGLTNPIFAYDRSDGCTSVTGGAFVPNGAWPPQFDGVYLFSDFVCGAIFKLVDGAGGSVTRETFVTGFGEGSAVELLFGPHDGGLALYYTTYGNGGEVRRIAHVGDANLQPAAAFTATPTFGPLPLIVDFDATASSDPDGDPLTYEWDFGDGTPGASGPIVQHTYTAAGTYTATLRVVDPERAESAATSRIDAGNTPPEPTVVTPAADQQFAVGDTIVLQGRATDAEDGSLPDSSLMWQVVRRHNTHTHPFLPPTAGNNITFPAPGPENLDAGGTSFLEVQLTATDSRGRTTTVSQALMPRTVRLDFLSDPPGATLTIDNAPMTTPASFVSWANFGVTVQAESQIGSDGAPLSFESWSDGGAASHTIVTPASPSSYTARFRPEPVGVIPTALPGTIEAENFDNGGRGVAYHDISSGNDGGEYRATDVDIAIAADAGGGYTIGWIYPEEWLKYSVNVGAAGSYTLEFRVASLGDGGTFHIIDANGANLTGPIKIWDTGGWQTWTTVTKTVNLTAGQQVWTVIFDAVGTGGYIGNLNYIRVASVPVTPLPGILQAEDFDSGGDGVAYHDTSPGNEGGQYRVTEDVDIVATSDAGGGHMVGWAFAGEAFDDGEWLKYTVNLGTAGTYDIEVRVASAGNGGTFHIAVNGVDKTGPFTVHDTGGWDTWTTIRKTGITLDAGQQVWQLVMDTNGPTTAVGNFNWIQISSTSPAGDLVREPYLQQVTDSSAIVVWTTRSSGAAEVRYAGMAGPTLSTAAETRLFPAAQTGLAFDYYQHEARLVSLAPASRYTYDIFVNGTDLTAGQDAFSTAPVPGGGTVRFIAFGDSGVGSSEQRQLAARMAADSFDLALHAGDVAYGTADGLGGGSYAQFDDWVFGVYAPWLRSHAFFPSIGNHDDEVGSAQPYRDVFVLPESGATATYPDHAERYYSFDYGPIHFIALDTELAFGDLARRQAQLAWLEADLSSTSQPWRVVYFHRPPYSSGTRHGSNLEVRQAFAPVFERHRVQFVVTAHEHVYERSVPWREYSTDGGAVTYIVTGGGGGPLYPVGMDQWTAASASVHHYVRATVGDCALELEAVGLDGAVFDRYSLDRCAQARDVTPPEVLITTPADGASVSGTVDVQVNATDDVRVEKVDLYVDGVLRAIDATSPYRWSLDTGTLSDGVHVLEARAYDSAGRNARSVPVSFTVANNTTPTDVVLYAADVSLIRGNWNRLPSTSGAGGLKMTSEDRGWSTAAPIAAPDDYFEATFDAPAGEYRLWLRLRGAADSKFNESVWVQFSDALDGAGAPQWPIGTDRALLVNLEDCGGCGISSWGWQDNAWWLGESSVVRFTAGGPHTIRIQTREDGVDIDQIVLSPARFFTTAPGPVRNDTTIVPK